MGGLLKAPFYRWKQEAEPLAEAARRANNLVGSAGTSEALLFCLRSCVRAGWGPGDQHEALGR